MPPSRQSGDRRRRGETCASNHASTSAASSPWAGSTYRSRWPRSSTQPHRHCLPCPRTGKRWTRRFIPEAVGAVNADDQHQPSPQVKSVRLVELAPKVIHAPAVGDLEAANRAAAVTLSPYFVAPESSGVWRRGAGSLPQTRLPRDGSPESSSTSVGSWRLVGPATPARQTPRAWWSSGTPSPGIPTAGLRPGGARRPARSCGA